MVGRARPHLPAPAYAASVTDHLARAPVAGATRALRRDRLPDGTPAVVKVVHQGEGTNPRWRSSTDEGDPYYWKREPLAYTTGFLTGEFDGPLRAPALLAAVEVEDGVEIWMEDAGTATAATWELPQYGECAYELGRAQGRYLAGRPLPRERWLSRGFLRAYTARHDAVDEELLAIVDEGPKVVAQLDFHPGNLFAADAGDIVVIDWAYCGIAAVGEDAGNLILDSMLDRHVDASSHAHALYEIVVRRFLDGLAAAGWNGDEAAISLSIDASMGAKFMWINQALREMDDAGAQRLATKYGEPFATIRAEWDAAMAFMAERAGQARASATSRRSAG